MKKTFLSTFVSIAFFYSALAASSDVYNSVPNDDENQKQYNSCVKYSNKKWEGGEEKSPIPGQTKAQAFCTCMWNETPEDFTGGLAKFSETEKGAKINKMCEKYSNWYEN